MATNIGTVIEGKYEILKLIGTGGMSYVYLAMDKRLNKQWAVKEIKKTANGKNGNRGRYQIYGFFKQDGTKYDDSYAGRYSWNDKAYEW